MVLFELVHSFFRDADHHDHDDYDLLQYQSKFHSFKQKRERDRERDAHNNKWHKQTE